MSYRVHVYLLDNNVQEYLGDIIALEGDTVEDVERFIMTSPLGHIYRVPFELTGVRIVGRRNGYDTVDFRNLKDKFTEVISKTPYAKRVLKYYHFDLSIVLRDLNNNANREYNYPIGEEDNNNNNNVNNDPIVEPSSSGASGSNKQVYGGKRKTMRKTKRKALKTKRHRK